MESDALDELRLLAGDQPWELDLPGGGGHDLITLSPLLEACISVTGGSGSGSKRLALAPIGLVNMLNAGGAVLACTLGAERGGGVWARIAARGCGSFLAYASSPPSAVEVDGAALEQGLVSWRERDGRLSFQLAPPAAGIDMGVRCVVLRF